MIIKKLLELDKTIFLRLFLKKSTFFLEKYDFDLLLFLTFFNLAYEGEPETPTTPYNTIKQEKSRSKPYINLTNKRI